MKYLCALIIQKHCIYNQDFVLVSKEAGRGEPGEPIRFGICECSELEQAQLLVLLRGPWEQAGMRSTSTEQSSGNSCVTTGST